MARISVMSLSFQSYGCKIVTVIYPDIEKHCDCNSSSLIGDLTSKWDKVFKNGPSKICGRQPLKHLKEYGLLKQTMLLQTF